MRLHWIGLLTALLMAPAHAGIPDDPAQVRPVSEGTRAPSFSARMADGALRTFSPDGYSRPTIVLFYRGGWCPYCNSQLSDLRLVEAKLRDRGFEIVFQSTDRPQLLYSSLKAADIHYTLLSDSHLRAARAFHVAYHLDDATLARQREYGVDLERTTGTKQHELPVPSVFIIDTSGTIRFVYSNPDYTIRLGADALWTAAAPFAMSCGARAITSILMPVLSTRLALIMVAAGQISPKYLRRGGRQCQYGLWEEICTSREPRRPIWVRRDERVASHIDPEPCAGIREDVGEA
jgi:peroxiredoxin